MATLLRPPPNDPAMSSMENTLELLQLSDIDPNLFTNRRPLWHPPGARGVYGGAVIAQCLAAAQKTVAEHFTVHSMHCYFVLAGNAEIPIIYHVERVRDGKSFATRTVQARQRAKVIFTVTLSFTRASPPAEKKVEHTTPMPAVDEADADGIDASRGPFESRYSRSSGNETGRPHLKRTRMWIKTRGHISEQGGHQAHLASLAYMSDSFFIGTVARAHRLWRTVPLTQVKKLLAEEKENLRKKGIVVEDEEESEAEGEGDGQSAAERDESLRKTIRQVMNNGKEENDENRPEIGMMVSLDHTIYFHRPRHFRADEWLLSEMETPWAGDNRGLVMQKIWSKDGQLVATCIQEGLVRLKQDGPGSRL